VFAVTLAPPARGKPSLPAPLGPVSAAVLDLPALDFAEPAVLTRLAVFAQPWPGAVAVWRSVDGASFARTAFARAPAIMGETLDPLPRGATSRWDAASRVRVRLYGGALASCSDAQLLDGANAAALRRADGAWEIIQYGQAVLVDALTYELSRLLRGQAGSEWAMGDPLPAGASFVRLDEHVVPVASGLGELDRPMEMRLVGSGRAHDDPSAAALTLTPQATALRPLAPVHATARRTAEGIRLSWIRRTRRDGDGWSAEVPLGEDQELYELDILSNGIAVRTLSSASSSLLYTASDELADFGTAQPTLSVRIAQLSRTVGRGVALETTLVL
jgi:hypothetical protein